MYSKFSCRQREPKCEYRRPEFTCPREENSYECRPGHFGTNTVCPKGRDLSFTKIADTSARFYPSEPPPSVDPRIWRKISRSLHKTVKSVPVDEIFACKTCNRNVCICNDDFTDLDEDDYDCNTCTEQDRCKRNNKFCINKEKKLVCKERPNKNCLKECRSPCSSNVSYSQLCPVMGNEECSDSCEDLCMVTDSYEPTCPIVKNNKCYDSCRGPCAQSNPICQFMEDEECSDDCRAPCASRPDLRLLRTFSESIQTKPCVKDCTSQCANVRKAVCVDSSCSTNNTCKKDCTSQCATLKKAVCVDSSCSTNRTCKKDCTSQCATLRKAVCVDSSCSTNRTCKKDCISQCATLKNAVCVDSSCSTDGTCKKDCTSQCATLKKAVCVESSCSTNETCKKDCSNQCKPICSDKCINPCALKISSGSSQTSENTVSSQPLCSYMKDKKCYDACKSPCANRTPVDKPTCPYMKDKECYDTCTQPCSKPFAEYMAKLYSGHYTPPTCAARNNQQKCVDTCTKNCRFRTPSTSGCPKKSNPPCSVLYSRQCVDICTKKCASQMDQQNGCCRKPLCPNKTFNVCPKKINRNCCCVKTCGQSSLRKAIKEYLSECDVLDRAIDDYIKYNSSNTRISPKKLSVNCPTCKAADRNCACKRNSLSPKSTEKYKLDVLNGRVSPKFGAERNSEDKSQRISYQANTNITVEAALVKHSPLEVSFPSQNDKRSSSIIEAAVMGLRKFGSIISESFKTTILPNFDTALVPKGDILSKPSDDNLIARKEFRNFEEASRNTKKSNEPKQQRPESVREGSMGIIQVTKSMEERLSISNRIQKSSATPLYSYKLRTYSKNSRLTFVPFKIYKFGERNSGTRSRGAEQDFYALRDYHLSNGTLFEDPNFPPNDSSLFYSRRPDRHYEWLRPHEIVDDPRMFVEGYSRFDVQQGELGDCWLLAAVANLTLYRRLFFQIVPDDNSFEEKYAGIFHFRFWQYGRWIDVVIDDKLPTYRGKLVFLHSPEENEFWSALLEKAYAKLHGSYEALKGGSTCEAMEDFTGGVTEMYEMNAVPPDLFRILLKAYERSSLMGCSIEPDPDVLEAETPEGLIKGHAYSITRVKYVDIETPSTRGKIPLLRLRNPWGNESEWNGAWSDRSPEWRFIPDHEKEELGLTFDHDGEFWMSFKDFTTRFSRLEICNLNPDSLTEEEMREGNKKQWEMSVFEGEWVRGVTAGGCRNFLETFWHNPQYRITLTEADDEDEDGKCTVIVALMQKNRRSQRNMGMDVLTIGFAIYYLPYPDRVPKPLDLNFFKYNASVARSPSFINLREVSCRFKLPPGTYCIVPSTFDPDEEGEFLLRVFSEHKNNMEENDQKVGYGELDPKIVPKKTFNVKAEVPTPETDKQTDKAYEFFLKIAGEDMEVGWKELKEILDYSMRNELAVDRKNVDGLDAAPNTEGQDAGEGLLMTILRLICGAVCKDSALIDVIPPPADASVTMSSRNEMNNGTFSKDICRSMVAMLDADKSGKLGYEEFKKLWIDLRHWKDSFKLYDRDNSNTLSGFELRQALNSAGYQVNNHILNILMHRYGNDHRELTFDDFIMCAVKLKCMIDIFKDKDPDETDQVTFTLEEWMENTLYS